MNKYYSEQPLISSLLGSSLLGNKEEVSYNFWKTSPDGDAYLVLKTPGLDKEALKARIIADDPNGVLNLSGSYDLFSTKGEYDTDVSIPYGYSVETAKVSIQNGLTYICVSPKKKTAKQIQVR